MRNMLYQAGLKIHGKILKDVYLLVWKMFMTRQRVAKYVVTRSGGKKIQLKLTSLLKRNAISETSVHKEEARKNTKLQKVIVMH